MLTRTDARYGKVFGALFLLYVGAALFVQTSFIVDPSYLHEEKRSLFRYHQTGDPGLFAGDYIASFFAAFPQPYLYDWATRLWLQAGGDLLVWHRLLPLACWLTFLAGIAEVARRIGDRVTLLGAVGLAVAQPIYLHQITSALPHAFAFPLLIWAVAALVHGSTAGLVVLTLLSGLLYPAMTPLLGLILAWHLVGTERLFAKKNPERIRALLLLAVTGAFSLWMVHAALQGTDAFGAALAPMQQTEAFPENGPQGRHFSGVFSPLAYVAGKAVTQFRWEPDLLSFLLLMVYACVALYGLAALERGSAGRRALAVFGFCALLLGTAVFVLKPFHSYRFFLYPAFTLLPLLFAVGLQRFCWAFRRGLRFPNAATLGLLALFALAFDSFDQKKLGYWWHLGADQQAVMAFAEARPQDSLFAVWPGSGSELEMIPYVARRPLFVMYKAHYPSYRDHLLAMRARMQALIDAYLATDAAGLRALHCDWNVDYLVVDREHFAEGYARPRYFAPFDRRIAEIWSGSRRQDFLLARPDPAWVAVATERYWVLDLTLVAGSRQADSRESCGPSGTP